MGPICFLTDMSFTLELLHRWAHFPCRLEPSSGPGQFPLVTQDKATGHLLLCHPEMLRKYAGPQGSVTLTTHGGVEGETAGKEPRLWEYSREVCWQVLSQGLGGSHSCGPEVLGKCLMTPRSKSAGFLGAERKRKMRHPASHARPAEGRRAGRWSRGTT